MNTFMTITSYGKNCNEANKKVEKKIFELENKFSTTKKNSLIYKINNSNEKSFSLDDDTYRVIKFGLDMADKTDGVLNIALYPIVKAWGFTTEDYKVPSEAEINQLLPLTDYKQLQLDFYKKLICMNPKMMIDLGALGKGYAGDESIKILKEYGIISGILNFGGNIQTIGSKPDGSDWKIGVKNPFDNSVALGIEVCNKAVITSGGYERNFTTKDGKTYIHIFDSKTGRPVENEVASVTIVSESGLYGDGLSTSMFALGVEKAFDYWKNARDFEMAIITKKSQLFYTAGLKNKISLIYDFDEISIIE